MDPQHHSAQHRYYRRSGGSRDYQQAPLVTYGSPRRSSSSQQSGVDHSSLHHRNSHSNGSMYTSSSQDHAASRQDTEYYYWHLVPRPWETENPQVRRSITDERLLSQSSASPQARDHSYQQLQQRAQYERSTDTSHPTGRFRLSDLQRLDYDRTSTRNITLWGEEGPRESAWNGIGYVRVERENRRRNGPP